MRYDEEVRAIVLSQATTHVLYQVPMLTHGGGPTIQIPATFLDSIGIDRAHLANKDVWLLFEPLDNGEVTLSLTLPS